MTTEFVALGSTSKCLCTTWHLKILGSFCDYVVLLMSAHIILVFWLIFLSLFSLSCLPKSTRFFLFIVYLYQSKNCLKKRIKCLEAR